MKWTKYTVQENIYSAAFKVCRQVWSLMGAIVLKMTPVGDRALKICIQAQVLLQYWNITQLQIRLLMEKEKEYALSIPAI